MLAARYPLQWGRVRSEAVVDEAARSLDDVRGDRGEDRVQLAGNGLFGG
jgi:hypothetical protein